MKKVKVVQKGISATAGMWLRVETAIDGTIFAESNFIKVIDSAGFAGITIGQELDVPVQALS